MVNADTAESVTLQVDVASEPQPHAPGTTIGRYVVLEEVGRGGMGRILRAYDPKLEREVALKELKTGVLDRAAAARLVAEARAMAKLSHPSVVSIYDVEELEGGQVVLVMEFVAGQTLAAWLDAGERPWREVVDAFVRAGRGLQAAHEAGLLHRDFKPANVLVDDAGPIKVTDFGIAKLDREALDSSLQSHDTSLTIEGSVIGTPRYMAPEQHRGTSLSAAADQYAFCVALWAGLCGEAPFGGDQLVHDKMHGPPAWPRRDVPKRIVTAIQRGLCADAEGRWPSMRALLGVLDGDSSRRRTRWALLGLGTVALIGSAAAYAVWAGRAPACQGARAGLSDAWDDAARDRVRAGLEAIERPYAAQAARRATETLDTYARDWIQMHTEACEATTLRGEQSPQLMDLRMACLQRAARQLGSVVEVLADADPGALDELDGILESLRPLTACADVEALTRHDDPPRPEHAAAVAEAREELDRSRVLRSAGRYDDATAAIGAANEALDGIEHGPTHAELALARGMNAEALDNAELAEASLRDAIRLASRSGRRRLGQRAATQLMHLLGPRLRRFEEALAYRPLAEGLSEGPVDWIEVHSVLGGIRARQGALTEAEPHFRTALGLHAQLENPSPVSEALSRSNLGNLLGAQGKYPEAEAEHRAALQQRIETLGLQHPSVADSRNNLGNALLLQGRHADARAQFEAALEIQEAVRGPASQVVGTLRNNLGNVLYYEGKFSEAEAAYRAALEIREAALGPNHPVVADTRNNLALVLGEQGKLAQAEAEHRAVLALREAKAPEHPDVAQSRANLGRTLAAQGRLTEAEAEYRIALALREHRLDAAHPDIPLTQHGLAETLLGLGRLEEARALAEAAWERRLEDDIPAEHRAASTFLLAKILWTIEGGERDRARARALAEDASKAYEQAGEAHAEASREVALWLSSRSEL